ncbi:MAG: hypothetical protein C0391_03615 [Anaerolinea sp.]|nr:hypothetical protein [Anaerolinea sp.]
MQDKLTRRNFIKWIGTAAAASGFTFVSRTSALAAPTTDNKASAAMKATPTVVPAPRPVIPEDEQRFLASHELIEGDTTRKVVMMTYDDILDDERLAHLLDVYREYSLKCSFFFIGIDLESCRATLPRLIAEGHDLGCHGWIHDSAYTSLTDQNIHEQFGKFFTKVAEILPGYRVRYFRAPYGDRNHRIRDLAAGWGMQHVLWSLESGGSYENEGSPLVTTHNVIDRVKNGSIVLSHANRRFDVSEADVIVRELVRKGYSLENLTTGMHPNDKWTQ